MSSRPPGWLDRASRRRHTGALAYVAPCPCCYGGGALVARRSAEGEVVVFCDDCGASFGTADEVADAVTSRPARYFDYPALASEDDLSGAGWRPAEFFRIPGDGEQARP